jgi:hypothetical protein
MMKSTLGIGLALTLVLLPALPAGAARKYCETQVHERLDRLDVAPSDIHDISYEAQRHPGRNSDRVTRVLAWVSLNSCTGYVIVELSPHCTVRQVYGRGECMLDGAVKPW